MIRLKITFCLLVAAMLLVPLRGGAWHSNEEGVILVISSYNPDTKRMSSFLSVFEKKITASNIPYNIYIENLETKGMTDASVWEKTVETLIHTYEQKKLKAVVLLGQEAWSAFMTLGYFPKNILFFGGFVSSNGILLPSDQTVVEGRWEPRSMDFIRMLDSMGNGGGLFNKYDVDRNLDLITTLYPGVENIAFVSDNTYGGISLQALVKEEMKRYPELTLTLVDSRDGEQQANRTIAALPEKSVILIGTWRQGSNGQYFTQNALSELVSNNPSLPVFSITGTGIGTVAAGGFIPQYNNGAETVAKQIIDASKGYLPKIKVEIDKGEYRFDSKKLREMKISEYSLPKGSIVVDTAAVKLEKYTYYINVLITLVIILILLFVFLIVINIRIRALKRTLEHREGELIEAKARAEESDMLKSAFLANMSHEIRTPLNAIVGFSTLMQDADLTPEEQSEYSSIVVSNSEMLLTLLNDILNISQLESGRIKFKYSTVDVVQICQHVVLTTSHTRAEGVEMIFKPSCESYQLYTDEHRLAQILINLLTNAAKFTSQGSITLAFEVQASRRQVVFSVTDTGTGIPTDKQEAVFNRFEKIGQKKGTGLGLAICRQIAMIFRGTITLDPTYTAGARFVLVLPIKKAPKGGAEPDFSGGGEFERPDGGEPAENDLKE